MTPKDATILNETLRMFSGLFTNESILLCSPVTEQVEIAKKYYNVLKTCTINEWNILEKSTIKADIISLSNVLMYISDCKLAIENLLNSCKYLIIQEPIYRNRGRNEFGGDGDIVRFSFMEHKAEASNIFDLSYLSNQTIYYRTYNDNDAKHIILIINKL